MNPVTIGLSGLMGVTLLGVVVWAGLWGTQEADRNFSVTFVFVTVWLGGVAASILFGDILRAFNPWAACARMISAIGLRRSGPILKYPDSLGCWPAVAGLVAFIWLELVYGQADFSTNGGVSPAATAVVALAYTSWTFVGITLFGAEKWLAVGETFSVYFRMYASVAIFQMRDGRLGVRPPLVGSLEWARLRGCGGLVVVTIGGTVFDGAEESVLKGPIGRMFDFWYALGFDGVTSLQLASSVLFLATLAAVGAVFLIGVRGIRSMRFGEAREADRSFIASCIPIALGYLAAHYLTAAIYSGQAQFGYLLSDPLGNGADHFGTAANRVDYTILNGTTAWYAQASALVLGHLAALVLAHGLGRGSLMSEHVRSRRRMLALMVTLTISGLYLLSQGNG